MQELIKIISDLIALKTCSRPAANLAVDYCAGWLESRHIKTELHDNNGFKALTAFQKGDVNAETIVLHGHVDVVPAREELFVPRIEGGKLYGRGAYDMLGAVAVMMRLVSRLNAFPLPRNVLLMLVSDEETGSLHGTPHLIKKGYLGDFFITGEPTNMVIGVQSKGVLQLELRVKGVSAHGSRPWLGENAIEKGLKIYQRLKELPFAKASNDFFKSPSLNLALIKGGKIFNQVPDECTLSLDIRYLPGQKVEAIVQEIETLSSDVETKVLLTAEPVHTSREDKYVRALAEVCSALWQKEPLFLGQDGSGDTRFFSALRVPAVEFGPVGAGHHGDGEYVDLPSLLIYEQILQEFICKKI